jgi:outer membrane receptor protein involved in Fe transport
MSKTIAFFYIEIFNRIGKMGWDMKKRAQTRVLYGLSAVALFTSQAFAADDGIETIVVTASKRAEDVQKVPFTVTALGQRDLTARGALSVEQAIAYVPGVNFSSNGTNAGAYTIRGVGTSSSVVNTQSPVALYIDDINILDPSYPKVTTNLDLFDVSRVEVLEGPQGTLFGSGALGGAIRVITNKPDASAFAAEAESTVSNVEDGGTGYDVKGMVNIPLVDDQLALRVVGYYSSTAGWVDNTYRNENNVNHAISAGGRVELGWQPTDDLKFVATALFENDRPHDSAYSFYGSSHYKWDGPIQNTNYNRTDIYSLTGDYDLHWATLTSITTYADRKETILADFTPDTLLDFGVAIPSTITDAGPSKTFSQEVRLTSSADDRFRWLIGGIYINNKRTVIEPVDVPGSHTILGGTSDIVSLADSRSQIREEAVYGEVSYDILPDLTATAGARYFGDNLKIYQAISGSAQIPSVASSKTNESALTPKFNLSYKFTPDNMVYVQAAEGYRIGQVNTAISDPVSGQVIPVASGPDRLWNYELGTKNTFFDDRLMANLAVYHIDWSDIQLDQYTVPSGINYIANAGKAHINGVELALEYKPTSEWDFGGSLSLLDSRLDQVNPTVAATKGDRLPASSPLNLVGYAQYTHPVSDDATVFARIDAKYVGKEYADLINATSLVYGELGTLNLRAGINWRNYALTAFVENLTDNDGKESAFYSFTVPVAIRQRPRTIGLTLDAKF